MITFQLLHDSYILDLTVADFQLTFNPKAASTLNLDAASRKLCPQLEHFFTWSSGTSGHGTAGQSNYGYANSVLERISEARQAAGYPSVPNNLYSASDFVQLGIMFKP